MFDGAEPSSRRCRAVVIAGLASGLLVAETYGPDGRAAAQTSDGPPAIESLALEAAPPDSGEAVLLPATTGPHPVGTRTYHRVLERPEGLTLAPSDRREVIAQLFYPAADRESGTPAAYVPALPLMRRGLLVHGFPPFAALSERMAFYGRVLPGGGFLASHVRWHPGDEVPSEEIEARDRELAERLAEDVEAVLAGLEPAVRQPRPVVRTEWADERVGRLGRRLAEVEGDAFDVGLRDRRRLRPGIAITATRGTTPSPRSS
ncbi:MAG: hypothetical protein R3266_08750 [Gemmatimonadota bacterium]|nr:hypothetical protein [Gemmatimonadota bacterium]